MIFLIFFLIQLNFWNSADTVSRKTVLILDPFSGTVWRKACPITKDSTGKKMKTDLR